MWEDPPISPHLKVYFFNLTNPEVVFNGMGKPVLAEIGPYTYTQKWIKQNITWHQNGTISYRTRKIFTFNSSLSCSTCNDEIDKVTTVNVPALAAYYQLRDDMWDAGHIAYIKRYGEQGALQLYLNHLGYKPWLTKNVRDIMWGYDEPLFHAAQKLMPKPPPFTDFALFINKNTSKEELMPLYTMYTGAGNPYKLATIHSWNWKTEMDFWNTSSCNKVRGSDGAAFNPYIEEQDTLWFFNDKMCRALPLVYSKKVNHKGLPGLRFQPREDVFMSAESYPENSCYAGPEYEVGNGVFDVRVCQEDAPIVLSWPHFLGAEEKYSNGVEGLNPDPEKHGFWFDIQKVTGTTLSAKARVQINMKVNRIVAFEAMKKVNNVLIPILWFEEGIDELGDDIIDVLKGAATEPQEMRLYILYCLVGLVTTMTLLCLVVVAKLLANRASIAKVERVRQILGGQIISAQIPENDSTAQLTQPMLAGLLDSSDSSRSSSATHSRTSSEGTTPAYAILPPTTRVVKYAPSGVTDSQPMI